MKEILLLASDSISSTLAAMRKFLVVLLFLPCSVLGAKSAPARAVSASTETDPRLERVAVLARGGATQLALQLIERHQPPSQWIEDWEPWERQRYTVYRVRQQWAALAQRVATLPAETRPAFRQWAMAEAADALMRLGQGDVARQYLRQLIWGAGDAADKATRARWRRLVIRSYTRDGRLQDAHTALQRYSQDYDTRGRAWKFLQAEVLLRVGKPKLAYEGLRGDASHEALLLRDLAALRAGIHSADKVRQRAQALVRRTADEALQRQAWALVAEAALKVADLTGRVAALEQLAEHTSGKRYFDGFVWPGGEDLWQAYFRLAEHIGNEKRLLVGDDTPWYREAALRKDKQPEAYRALLALLAFRATDEAARNRAHTELVESLLAAGIGKTAQTLYAVEQRFADVVTVPPQVRYRLASRALQLDDIPFAARMMGDLESPPDNDDPVAWRLRRARVLVYAGRHGEAIELVESWLDQNAKLDATVAQRLSHVLFDLQSVKLDEEALRLFRKVFDRVDDPRQQREFYFWMGDSCRALGRHVEAAEFYLRSALHEHEGRDMWGQSARFQAATAMAEAGLTDDARAMYAILLGQTRDPKQRAVIQRSRQRLWLYDSRKTTTPSSTVPSAR